MDWNWLIGFGILEAIALGWMFYEIKNAPLIEDDV